MPSGVWSVGFVRPGGDGPATLVLGGMDHRIYKLSGREPVAIAKVGGPPLRVLGADLNGDGTEEIVVAAADYPSHLYAFGLDGTLIWKAKAEGCYVDAAAGTARGKPVIAAVDFFGGVDLYDSSGKRVRTIRSVSTPAGPRRISEPTTVALGDLDGDGEDDIVTSHYRGGVTAFRAGGTQLWYAASSDTSKGWERFGVVVPEPVRINGKEFIIELQRGGNFARNLRIADLDNDGRPEVLAGFFRSQLMALSNSGRLLWNKILNYDVVHHMMGYVHMDQRGVYKDSVAKSHPIFEIAGRPDGKKWIVALQPREDILNTSTHFGATDIFILDARGRILQRDIRDATWFRLAVDPARPDELWLVNRVTCADLYRTRLGRLAEGLPKQRINDITPPVRNWLDAGVQLSQRPRLAKTPEAPERKVSIVVLYDHASFDMYFFGFEALKHNLLAMNRFFNGRGLRNVEYIFRVNLQEIPHGRTDTQVGLVTRQQAFQLAEFVEKHKIPVILWLSHGTAVTLSPETMIGFSERAPTAFRGVMQVESGGLTTPAYRQFLGVLRRIAPRFAAAGQKIFMHTTGPFWSQAPAVDPDGLGRLIREDGKLLVPFIKTNNSQWAEQEIGAVLALWKAGYIDEWGYTSIDHWTFTNIFRMNAFKMASHMGAVDIAALGLGARYILYYPPIIGVDRDTEGKIQRVHELSPQLAHMKVIEQLVEKRMMEPVAPGQVQSLAPILFTVNRLPDRTYGSRKPGILMKTIHFQQTAPGNASTMFYGPGIGSSKMVPPTPHGIYGILPFYLDARRVPGIRRVFATDLYSVDGGPAAVERAMAREPMLFRADGAFTGIQQFSGGRYRICLVDPGHIDQRGVSTRLRYQGPGRIAEVTDRVSGAAAPYQGNVVPVNVKPGLFRILDVAIRTSPAK